MAALASTMARGFRTETVGRLGNAGGGSARVRLAGFGLRRNGFVMIGSYAVRHG